MDHGLLNVPLAKRGDIDAQLDAYRAEQARVANRTRKAAAQATAELRTTAKALVKSMSDERIAELAQKLKSTPAQVRRLLMSNAHWMPQVVIATAVADSGGAA
ncbi:MAG: hypothetical protein J0H69_17090 [Burkholderiales bacterium]|nr:hypothetical protein [Burkholderiales bacterium]